MEWVLVLIVVVILFFGGAKKIPEFAQNLGRARGEYERGRMEVERQMAADRSPVAPGAPAGRFCPRCGSPASTADAAFCGKCGASLPAPAA